MLLGREAAELAVFDLATCGAAAAIVLASGYAETGEEGTRQQQALKRAAGGMRLLGPNTIGLINLNDRVVLSASGALEIDDLPTGRISIVSQSGGILGSLLSRAADRGIGLAKLTATGNEADLDSCDFIEQLLDDETSVVIAVYIEGLRQPERFRRLALRAAALGKPIVAFKVGRSPSGARAASSHTGALAGTDRVYEAMFRQCGVVPRPPSPISSTFPPPWHQAAARRDGGWQSSPPPAGPAPSSQTAVVWPASSSHAQTRRPPRALPRREASIPRARNAIRLT